MDAKVNELLIEEAKKIGLSVAPSYEKWIDQYLGRYFKDLSETDSVVIQTYLSEAALRIARTDKKRIVEADDGKAAVWLFHQPDQINQECVEAGQHALRSEARRNQLAREKVVIGGVTLGLLTESFARHLDSRERGYRRYL